MKKHFLISLTILFLLSISNTFGQNAFDYTLKWQKIRDEIPSDSIKDNNLKKFKENPFDSDLSFEELKKSIEAEHSRLSLTSPQKQSSTTGIFDKIPSNFQSILIDGIAKYSAEAFREQATTIYIDKFKRELQKTSDFKYILPKTFKYLNEEDLFNYEKLGNSIKQTFNDDLDNILSGLKDFVDKSNLGNSFCKNNNEVCNAIKFSLDVGNQIKVKTSFVELINYLDRRYTGDKAYEKNYYNLIHSINLIQANIRKDPTKTDQTLILSKVPYQKRWLTVEDFSEFKTSDDWVYFLALIYHQDKEHRLFKNDVIKGFKINNDPTGKGKELQKYILTVISLLQSIENIQAQEQVKADEYIEIFSNLSTLIKLVNDMNHFVDDKYVEITQSTIDMAKSIVKKDYTSVVKGSTKILRNVLKDNTDSSSKYISKFIKYGTFMVDVTTTKNSDDLKEAIKRNVTSYTYLNKRKSDFSIILNADPGIIPFTGFEGIDSFNSTKNTFAVTCPIGFDIVVGSRKNESYYGLSLNVIDIGAAFAYRLNDSESELPEKITLKQVFSPGLALKHGIRNTPICWALGYQYTPALRTVTSTNITEAKSASRFFLRFTWDLPLAKIIGNK
ncbi:hypothetical protein [Arcicella lustrica]|uniref:Uncharacterized protein n=1 Tax=Arcicella lustrica TaxID=2984196 RepID=A0ABU5SME3_9BACT|nr:hypothetical protein [Arcicella sp. DC25W]MEA5428480.1 hypothetical protein [Arcicella sp. DC25W]